MQFGGDIGIGPEDISRLEPEIAYVTSNSDIEAIALVTDSGYQIAYAAINRSIDSDALCGIASALTSTSNMVTKTVFNENLSEVRCLLKIGRKPQDASITKIGSAS